MKITINWKLLFGCFAGTWGIPLLVMCLLPFVVGNYVIRLGFSESEAGAFVTVELLAVGLTSLLLSPWVSRIHRHLFLPICAAIGVAANVACIFAETQTTLALLRLMAGIACGGVMAIGNAVVASYDEPERLYGEIMIVTTLMVIVLYNLVPVVTGQWGAAGIFGMIAVTYTLFTPLLHFLPEPDVTNSSGTPDGQGLGSWLTLPAVLTLATIFLFCARDTLVYAFAEISGARVGLSPEAIGVVFSVQSVVGLFGPIIVTIIGVRYGRVLPIMAGIIGTGLITYTVSQTSSANIYSGVVVIWIAVHFFTMSYLMGMAASADHQGRVIAASAGAMMMGNAIAPIIAGQLIDWRGFPALGWANILAVALTATLAVLVLKKLPAAGLTAEPDKQA